MTLRERALLVLSVWLCVFPGVLVFSYAFRWLGLGWPLWLQIMVSTACTVPLINLVAVPSVERLIAAARHQSVAEFKLDQARTAKGADPEAVPTAAGERDRVRAD